MTSCKLMVYYPDDLRILTGKLTGENPITVELQGADDLGEDILSIRLKWYDNLITKYAKVSLTAREGGRLTFDIISDINTTENESHFIEFREHFEVLKTDETLTGELRYRVDRLNNRYRSSLTNQVKKIITDETLTNQYILKMLMRIDTKMDELLDSMKADEMDSQLTEVKTLGMGGAGLTFIYHGDIAEGDTLYLQSMPKNGSQLNFAAFCRVTDIVCYEDRCICDADFSYIDESTREAVIHHIFTKERETLKRNRS